MNQVRKMTRARNEFGRSLGVTEAVFDQVPAAVVRECPARIVAPVANAIDKAYHAGRASTGAAVEKWGRDVNRGMVWVSCIGRHIKRERDDAGELHVALYGQGKNATDEVLLIPEGAR